MGLKEDILRMKVSTSRNHIKSPSLLRHSKIFCIEHTPSNISRWSPYKPSIGPFIYRQHVITTCKSRDKASKGIRLIF